MSRASEILGRIAENGQEDHFGSGRRRPSTWHELHDPDNQLPAYGRGGHGNPAGPFKGRQRRPWDQPRGSRVSGGGGAYTHPSGGRPAHPQWED